MNSLVYQKILYTYYTHYSCNMCTLTEKSNLHPPFLKKYYIRIERNKK